MLTEDDKAYIDECISDEIDELARAINTKNQEVYKEIEKILKKDPSIDLEELLSYGSPIVWNHIRKHSEKYFKNLSNDKYFSDESGEVGEKN